MKPDSYKLKGTDRDRSSECSRFDELTVQENIDYFCGLYDETGNGEKSWWRMLLNLQVLKISAKCTRRSFPEAFCAD